MGTETYFTFCVVPFLIFALDRVERRFGSTAAGWMSGFPIVGGPALLIVTMEHGTEFGANAALGALQSVVGWSFFILSYRFFSRFGRSAAVVSLISIAIWAVASLAATTFAAPTWIRPIFVVYAIGLAVVYGSATTAAEPLSLSVLWARLVLAPAFVALILFVSYVGERLVGQRLAGVLAAFPIVSGTLLISSTIKHGSSRTLRMTSGMLLAGPALSTFFLLLAGLLPMGRGAPAPFALSVIGAGAVHIAMWHVLKRRGQTSEHGGHPVDQALDVRRGNPK